MYRDNVHCLRCPFRFPRVWSQKTISRATVSDHYCLHAVPALSVKYVVGLERKNRIYCVCAYFEGYTALKYDKSNPSKDAQEKSENCPKYKLCKMTRPDPHCLSGVPRLKKRSTPNSKAINFFFFRFPKTLMLKSYSGGILRKNYFCVLQWGYFHPAMHFQEVFSRYL